MFSLLLKDLISDFYLSHILYKGMRSTSEAKLYLYALAKKGTFCVRAPNTLCSEGFFFFFFFFSTMQEMGPRAKGCRETYFGFHHDHSHENGGEQVKLLIEHRREK